MSTAFIVHFGFYRTADNPDEMPFVVETLQDGEEKQLTVEGQDLTVSLAGDPRNRIARCQGKPVFADVAIDPEGKVWRARTEVANGLFCQVKVDAPPLKRRIHPDGKTCGECALWNHEKGIEMLNSVHTKYQEDMSLKLFKEVADQVATNYGLPMITNDNVGYCPKTSALTAEITPACEEGFIPK